MSYAWLRRTREPSLIVLQVYIIRFQEDAEAIILPTELTDYLHRHGDVLHGPHVLAPCDTHDTRN